jgi:glutathione S-transferase
MTGIELIGLRISVYTRIARLALEEKNVDYTLREVDIFADDGPPADYLELHPFGMIPCLRDGDRVLYETGAITRYIDEANPGPRLQPQDVFQRARMNQIVSVLDAYAYTAMVWDVYVQRNVVTEGGGSPDEALIEAGLKQSYAVLQQLEAWCEDHAFLTGDALTLADLYAYPMLLYFSQTVEGDDLLQDMPRLQRWMARMHDRPSVQATPYYAD